MEYKSTSCFKKVCWGNANVAMWQCGLFNWKSLGREIKELSELTFLRPIRKPSEILHLSHRSRYSFSQRRYTIRNTGLHKSGYNDLNNARRWIEYFRQSKITSDWILLCYWTQFKNIEISCFCKVDIEATLCWSEFIKSVDMHQIVEIQVISYVLCQPR